MQDYSGEEPFYLQLNYDGPYTNPPTNYGSARNRFYRDYVGRVLAALREKGLDKNTLVIFSSDQGNFYGQHGIWQHTIVTTPSSMYESAMNIPLIIRHPDKIEAGRTSDLLIGQYDIPVTILDYAGMGDVRLENSPGKSFRFALTGETGKRKDAVFFEQEETRVIRTEDHAYWKRLNSTGEPALYDVKKDPEQNRNGYDDPAYQEIVADMDTRLTDFFDEYSDEKYDLWKGGGAKGSVDRPEKFKRLYGPDWTPKTEIKPAFSE